jgi:hypothetical protein
VFSEYLVPTSGAGPEEITVGPDGAMWFSELDGNKIGRITTAGAITEYAVPATGVDPYGIANGPDGALWFTGFYVPVIGRITPSGLITTFPIKIGAADGGLISTGPDGGLWFTESNSGGIGRAPACALGFSASFANDTLTMNFDLGINVPASFGIALLDSSGPIGTPFIQSIPAVVPPQTFTLTWNSVPNEGTITVRPELGSAPGQGYCAEWSTINTAE